MTFLDLILRRQRVVVKETERAIVLGKGEVRAILGPGEHMLAGRSDEIEVLHHDIEAGSFSSPLEKALFDKLPAVAEQHLRRLRTAPSTVALVERDGVVHAVLGPDRKLTVWNAAGPWAFTPIEPPADLAVEPGLIPRLVQARKAELVLLHAVQDGQVGLLYVDGAFIRTLPPGVHGFWNIGKPVQVKAIDVRQRSLDVNGQEVLTRDRVTIRVNIAAEFRVADPVKAVTAVKDCEDAFYRALQYAFRKALGTLTLDQLLERKTVVDAEAAEKVRVDMAAIGIEVGEIALKDVILPGEMREILNQVVPAEKQAEANVIRRREETNATRSLLNTAKVMAENPVMLRLKELEALEAIAGKVERLTVHNGVGGLMNDLVKLRDLAPGNGK